jgi:hypothetical protein
VQRGSKEDSSQQDRRTDLGLGYLLICISSEGPLSQDGSPDFIAIKSSQIWFSRKGFSRGFLPESRVQMFYGFCC